VIAACLTAIMILLFLGDWKSTLIPTLAMYWIRKHEGASHQGKETKRFSPFGWASRFHQGFEYRFEKFREAYRDLLSLGLRHGGKLVSLISHPPAITPVRKAAFAPLHAFIQSMFGSKKG